MKVKNIAFSGFAAALFVGVCGAANANTTTTAVELTSKTYVDRAVLDVATEVGKKANAADVYTKGQVDSTVATLATKTELEDTTEALQESIDKISAGDVELTNYYTKSEMNESLADKADKATTYTKDEADAEFMTFAEVASAIGTSTLADRVQTNQTDIADINKSAVMTSGVNSGVVSMVTTNADNIGAIGRSEFVQSLPENDQTLTGAVNSLASTKADKSTTYTKTEADDAFVKVADVDTVVARTEQVLKNTADITGLASTKADKTQVATDIATALADQNSVNEGLTTLQAEANKGYVSFAKQEDGTLTVKSASFSEEIRDDISNAPTAKAVDAAIKAAVADVPQYDDTALAARVTENEDNISSNTSAIETLQGTTESLKGMAFVESVSTENIVNSAVTTDKIKAGDKPADGEMVLMTTGADGNVSWMPVKVYY